MLFLLLFAGVRTGLMDLIDSCLEEQPINHGLLPTQSPLLCGPFPVSPGPTEERGKQKSKHIWLNEEFSFFTQPQNWTCLARAGALLVQQNCLSYKGNHQLLCGCEVPNGNRHTVILWPSTLLWFRLQSDLLSSQSSWPLASAVAGEWGWMLCLVEGWCSFRNAFVLLCDTHPAWLDPAGFWLWNDYFHSDVFQIQFLIWN